MSNISVANKELELFNKTLNSCEKQGTLVGNWWEERELRNATGVGRTLAHSHFPKNHMDLFKKPLDEVDFLQKRRKEEKLDDTNERILGKKKNEKYNSENSEYGRGKNKALDLSQVGKKHELLEKQFFSTIMTELSQQQKEIENQTKVRHFDTTKTSDFGPKSLNSNTVGRRVMKDQNLNVLIPDERDEDFLVEYGMIKRAPVISKDELKGQVSIAPYFTQVPTTFYTDKVKDGCYYMSNTGANRNPFGLNNEFVKTFHHYKHYKN